MKRRVIYCAGDEGRVVLDIVLSNGVNRDNIVFIDDDYPLLNGTVEQVPVIGDLDSIDLSQSGSECIIAFGARSGVRLSLAEKVRSRGIDFFTAIHPDATVSDAAEISSGTIVNALSYIGPGTCIKSHVLIDSGIMISHDVTVGEGTIITPGVKIAGNVRIRKDVYVGPGATLAKNVRIGTAAVIGAGAVVLEDVPAETTVAGVPASPLGKK